MEGVEGNMEACHMSQRVSDAITDQKVLYCTISANALLRLCVVMYVCTMMLRMLISHRKLSTVDVEIKRRFNRPSWGGWVGG